MLSGVIKPTGKAVLKTGGNHKFTIPDSFMSMVILVKDITDFESTIERTAASQNKFVNYPNQPYVIVIGESYEKINQCFCISDGIRYKAQSFIHALDLCFKLFYVLRLEYPTPSFFVWVFLEKFIYDMSETKKISSNVNILVRQFKQ
jgi:hypothetical protein